MQNRTNMKTTISNY